MTYNKILLHHHPQNAQFVGLGWLLTFEVGSNFLPDCVRNA